MATIRTAIQIQDQLSRPVRAMHNSISMMVNQMEAMNIASGHMMDTSSIEISRRELARAAEEFSRIEDEVRNADNGQRKFNNNIRDGTSAADGLLNKIMGIAAAYFSFQTGKNIVGLSDEMINTQARLELMNSGYHKNAEAVNNINSMLMTTSELQKMIFDSAQRTYTSYQSTAAMVGKLGMQASAAFSNTTEIVAFAEQINKTFRIAGTSVEGVDSVMLQLTQAMAAGVLQGEELNAILDNAQPIVANIQRYLKEAMNIDASNIKKLASDGIITADIIKKAMFYAAEETNAAFGKMPATWSGIWTVMTDRALRAFNPILQKINDVANSDKVKQMMENITLAIENLAIVATFAMDILIAGGSFVYDHWAFLGPIILGVAGALLAFVGYLTLARTATMLMTAAQWAWNAAMTANPIGLIIVGIVLLISLFYLAIATINHFAGTSYSATGAIAGFFMMLGAVVYNVVAYMWNMWASFIEFFANVSKNKTYAVRRLFYNLATNVLDVVISMTKGWDGFATSFVNAIIKAVNLAIQAWNWFINLLPDGITSRIGLKTGTEFSHRESITSDLNAMKGALKDWVGEAPADYWEAPKMEMKSLGAAYDKGYNWGANLFGSDKNADKSNSDKAIENAMKNAMNGAAGPSKGLGDKLDKGNRNGAKTAGNTAKMAKSMEGSGEDLKYLRDIAERESIDRYTIAEINIDARSENHINNEMDIDGVIDRFTEKAEEAAQMLAEGGPTEFN
ncbi:tape measure protein [Lysinibacillus sp. NPDC093190]|uniref:tape measure protein n=1 Tax=Lysinibacillus sp. NPDC093190 TaxID=3390575 RepID=UPI003D018959